MRKHPVLWGIVLLVVLGAFFYAFFYKAGQGSGNLAMRPKTFAFGERIGVVPVEGVISDSFDIRQNLEDFGKDDSIVAVVVRIDSPGGGVAASQEIYDAILQLRKKKKVVASMGSVAASGGLLIACAADKIVANPGTITGSISAIMQFANIEELLGKIGVKSSVVKSGPYKDIGSPVREMTPEERQIIQELVDDIYNQFIDVIVEGRNLPREQVMAIADGRLFSGRKAKELGLVDQMGDLSAAARTASELAGRDGTYELIFPKKIRPGVFDYLFESAASAFIRALDNSVRMQGGANYRYDP